MSEWQSVETCPHDTLVLLGWWRTWPETVWECEVRKFSTGERWKMPGHLGTYSNYSQHGMATHWMPLPPPPEKDNA